MKKRRISFQYKGKKISLDTLSCNTFEMGRGLMFRTREKAPALLFEFGKLSRETLTSLFVFFPFIVIWFEGNQIVELRVIKPFIPAIRTKKAFNRIVEIPLNKRYSKEIKLLVGD